MFTVQGNEGADVCVTYQIQEEATAWCFSHCCLYCEICCSLRQLWVYLALFYSHSFNESATVCWCRGLFFSSRVAVALAVYRRNIFSHSNGIKLHRKGLKIVGS